MAVVNDFIKARGGSESLFGGAGIDYLSYQDNPFGHFGIKFDSDTE